MGTIDDPPLDDLNLEQLDTMRLALQGHSLFITGAAGTGKTHLLSRIHRALCYKHGYRPRVVLTASTGMAAMNVQGALVVLHLFPPAHPSSRTNAPFLGWVPQPVHVRRACRRKGEFQLDHPSSMGGGGGAHDRGKCVRSVFATRPSPALLFSLHGRREVVEPHRQGRPCGPSRRPPLWWISGIPLALDTLLPSPSRSGHRHGRLFSTASLQLRGAPANVRFRPRCLA